MATETKTDPAERPNQAIYWDDAHIAAEAATLPAAMREDYIWLKNFLRDQCRHDVDVLTEKFRDVGVTVDKTNWTRIVKGRWRKDPRGFECTPCISQENFTQSIVALRDQIRVELLRGGRPFVETTVYNTIRRFIEKKMRPDRVNKFGLIVGPTGTQKSESYKEIARRNRFVKWLEAPDNGSIKEFALRLSVKCGMSQNISYFSARTKLFQNVTRDNCIIIDNTQDLVKDAKEIERMGKSGYTQPAFQLMRSLQDETGCTIIWSITPENEEQMFSSRSETQQIYNEQFEGRLGGLDSVLRLPNYSPKRDVIQIAEAMGLKDAEKQADRLYEISQVRGRIRRFFEILQEAKDDADDDGVRLSMTYVETVMTRIEEDAARRAKKGGAK